MDSPKAELLHIEVDRRLGHQWDEWNGAPLPGRGNFDSPPSLFFRWALVAGLVVFALLAALLFVLAPRLAELWPPLTTGLWILLGASAGLSLLWWTLLAISHVTKRSLLPPALAERGLYLRVMQLTSKVAARFGRRDWVENAAVKVYNTLALGRARRVNTGELLLLVPRCLSRATLDGVLSMAGRYQVPVFVATRGQLARRVIKERRPRAVVAVACERDMVTGLHDVAGKVPVLGLIMRLPAGPCKDAEIDLERLEEYMKAFVS